MKSNSPNIFWTCSPVNGFVFTCALLVWGCSSGPTIISEPETVTIIPIDIWRANWIAYATIDSNLTDTLILPPPAYFRKIFTVDREVDRAVLHFTALGLADIHINGERITEDRFLPGWSDYTQRLYYLSYEVTELLKTGENTVEATLADGWYAGYVGPKSLSEPLNRNLYGSEPALLVQLDIDHVDGQRQSIVTDSSWQATTGPLRYADLLMGEGFDANRKPGPWSDVKLRTDTIEVPTPYLGNTTRPYDELIAVAITEPSPGTYLIDFGQNFAGHVRLAYRGDTRDTITLRHGEMLNDDGSLMTENLRFARATDTYVASGEGEEVWEPRFTYHGFRYVEVTGLTGRPDTDLLTGIAVSASTPLTSTLASSDTLLKRLYDNIIWTQRSNFIEVPTDSPQRDERLGWLGDAQIFSRTALYNAYLHDFYGKWLADVRDAQYDFGAYANFAPRPYPDLVWYSPGWMEAGIMVPYNDYRFYGDTSILSNHYASMEHYFEFTIEKSAATGYFYPENSWTEIGPKGGFGDWLSLTEKHLSHDLMASMYFAYSLRIMSEMSEALGKTERMTYYRNIYEKAVGGFTEHYVGPGGKFVIDAGAYGDGEGYFEGEKGFTGHTQSGYATAIYFDLLPDSLRQLAADHLVDLVVAADTLPTSGILGIRQLLPALSRIGRSDLAYAMVLSTEYPGWGFQIANGATTVWERWNSYTREEGFNGEMNTTMNSFNHYAFGAVGQWLFQEALGIEEAEPGFDGVVIQPRPDQRVDRLAGTYKSVKGTISSEWEITDAGFRFEVSIPINMPATVLLPAPSGATLLQDGREVLPVYRDGHFQVEVGPGRHRFEIRD